MRRAYRGLVGSKPSLLDDRADGAQLKVSL
jgi:hypothetical protein